MPLRCCNQSTVAELGLVKSMFSLSGGLRVGHSSIMCCAVGFAAPHVHAAVGCRPHPCMLAFNWPTPVSIRFRVTHTLQGSCAPGGNLSSGVTVSWVGQVVCCQPDFQVLRMVPLSVAAWLEKGQQEGRHW